MILSVQNGDTNSVDNIYISDEIEALRTVLESFILRFQRQKVPSDISLRSRIFVLVYSANRHFSSWKKSRECSYYYD